jgi:hypothetical protein
METDLEASSEPHENTVSIVQNTRLCFYAMLTSGDIVEANGPCDYGDSDVWREPAEGRGIMSSRLDGRRERSLPVRPDEVVSVYEGGGRQLPSFKPDPHLTKVPSQRKAKTQVKTTHFQHRSEIPRREFPHRLLRGHLPPQLPQNRQRALEQVQLRIELPSDAFEQQDRNDGVDKVALHLDMVLSHRLEHVRQDVGDPDLSEGERLALDAQDEMLHLERKGLRLDGQFGSSAAFYHELSRSVAVKFGDGAKKVKEVLSIDGVERRH